MNELNVVLKKARSDLRNWIIQNPDNNDATYAIDYITNLNLPTDCRRILQCALDDPNLVKPAMNPLDGPNIAEPIMKQLSENLYALIATELLRYWYSERDNILKRRM